MEVINKNQKQEQEIDNRELDFEFMDERNYTSPEVVSKEAERRIKKRMGRLVMSVLASR